jgi:nicotinate phosphoribosyltransferase
LLAVGAPVDLFGVGTEMVTSRDAPALGGVYKLVEQVVGGERVGRMKRSAGKATYPGAKQVFRHSERGLYCGGVIAASDEKAEGVPLLVPVMKEGRLCAELPALETIRRRTLEERTRLPSGVLRLSKSDRYPIRFRAGLEEQRSLLERPKP